MKEDSNETIEYDNHGSKHKQPKERIEVVGEVEVGAEITIDG